MAKVYAKEGEKTTTPKGYFVVYVGKETKRFVIPTSYLKKSQFKKLLEEAAEEYGFSAAQKGIVLPCDESTFRRVINFIKPAK